MGDPQLTPIASGRRSELAVFAKKALIVLAIVIVTLLLWRIRRILVLIFIAAVLAAGIAPAVRRVQILLRLYTKRKVARGTAVLIVYLPFLLTIILVMALTVPHLVAESQQLSTEMPALIDAKLLKPIEKYIPVDSIREALRGGVKQMPVFGYLRSAATLVSSVVAVLFMIVYMLIDAERLRNVFLLLYPANQRAAKRNVIRRVSRRMSSWLSGQLILASIIGVATFVALVALRIPYALPLALIAAAGEMVPVIGPILGAVPPLVVALFKSNWQFWSVLAVAILIQQVENLFLVPRIIGNKVSISPLAVFVAFMTGATLLGIVGAIMAVPAAVIVQVIFEEGFVSRRERRQTAGRPGTLTTEKLRENARAEGVSTK
jgi:predicted PurR-regulated permease PerM